MYFVVVCLLFILTEPTVKPEFPVALMFLATIVLFAGIRFYYYLILPGTNGFTIPVVYFISIYGGAAAWGLFSAWLMSLDTEFGSLSAAIVTTDAAAAAVAIITLCTHRWLGMTAASLFYVPTIIYLFFFRQAENALLINSLIGLYFIFLNYLSKHLHFSYWKERNAQTALKNSSLELEAARNEAVTINTALEVASNEATSANTAKTEFLAHMSHDIRTPLNGVIGMAEMLATTRLDERQQQYVNTIQESGRLMVSLVNDILDFSQINSGKTSIQLQPVSVSAVARDCTDMLQAQATPGQNTLILQDNLPPHCLITTDRLRLQQLINNLLNNALKFTRRGIISLELDLYEKNALYTLSVAVRDTGIGIPENSLNSIFEAFHQLAKPGEPGTAGSGLGLAICKKLVQLLNGEIRVESVVSEGSCFSITLPVDAPVYQSDAVTKQHIRNEIINQHSFKILVVEDNRVNRMVMEAFLEKLGYSFSTVTSGKAALEAWREHQPDLILMDLNLPDISGQAVTQLVREHEIHGDKRTVVIAITAHAFDNIALNCKAAGMDDLVIKPLTLAKLKQTLEQWLKRPAKD